MESRHAMPYSNLCPFRLPVCTLCHAIVLPGRKSALRAGFWPDCYWEGSEIGLRPADGRPDGVFRCFPGSSPAKIRPGRPTYGPEALLRDTEYKRAT